MAKNLLESAVLLAEKLILLLDDYERERKKHISPSLSLFFLSSSLFDLVLIAHKCVNNVTREEKLRHDVGNHMK